MKSGIDYFPLDVSLDSKFELIEAEFGITGFGVVVKLLQYIYGGQGYYAEWTNEVALLFAKRVGVGGSVVSEIINAAVRRGMFDKNLYDTYKVLTSRGIQKRYFEAISRRKEIEVDYNILLVDVAQICKNANIRHKNVNILSENADISKQSKVKESKVKYSKVEDNMPHECGNSAKTQKEQIKATVDKSNLSDKVKKSIFEWLEYKQYKYKELGITKLITMFEKHCQTYGDDAVIQLVDLSISNGWQGIQWDKLSKQHNITPAPKQNESSFDTEEFFKTALQKSYERARKRAGV